MIAAGSVMLKDAGPFLLIDLWSGFGGAAMALLSMGVSVYCLAAVTDPFVRAVVAENLDGIVHVNSVEKVSVDMVRDFLQRRKVKGIILGGGGPCQRPLGVQISRVGRRCVIQWRGKPIPGRMRPVDGFQLITRKPQDVVNGNGEEALFPSTQEFQHPDEKTQATAGAKSRWQQDGRRFPQLAYEAENLVWRVAEWRTLRAEERATLHGFSPEVAKPAQVSRSAPGRDVEAMANSAIGNGSHLPSMMLFMFLLLQGVVGEEQQMQSPYCGIGVAADEEDLRRRIAGTVYDEKVLKSTQGILRPRDIIHQLHCHLDHSGPRQEVSDPMDKGCEQFAWC